MKKVILSGFAAGIITLASSGISVANAAPTSWTDDESAFICTETSQYSTPDLVSNTIFLLQMKHNLSRADAVAGMREAVTDFCPSHLSAVPTR